MKSTFDPLSMMLNVASSYNALVGNRHRRRRSRWFNAVGAPIPKHGKAKTSMSKSERKIKAKRKIAAASRKRNRR